MLHLRQLAALSPYGFPGRHTGVSGCFVALAIGLASTAHAAAQVQCPDGRGVYQAVSAPSQELAFAGEKGTLTVAKGRARASFPFTITQSNGFSRTHLEVAGRDAPSTTVMTLNPDFTPYRGDGSAPYIMTPDLPVGFYYWDPFRSRADFMDLLPGDAWHLVRCVGGNR